MKSEKEKMLAGELYDPLDAELTAERLATRLLVKALNDTREDEVVKRKELLEKLIPNAGSGLWLQPPFYCDYGHNMKWTRRQCGNPTSPQMFSRQAIHAR